MFPIGWEEEEHSLWDECLLRQRKDLAGWTVWSVFAFSVPRAGLDLLQAGNSSCLDKYCMT